MKCNPVREQAIIVHPTTRVLAVPWISLPLLDGGEGQFWTTLATRGHWINRGGGRGKGEGSSAHAKSWIPAIIP
jgi:hypothetical protein